MKRCNTQTLRLNCWTPGDGWLVDHAVVHKTRKGPRLIGRVTDQRKTSGRARCTQRVHPRAAQRRREGLPRGEVGAAVSRPISERTWQASPEAPSRRVHPTTTASSARLPRPRTGRSTGSRCANGESTTSNATPTTTSSKHSWRSAMARTNHERRRVLDTPTQDSKTCQNCGLPFVGGLPETVHCSRRCASAWASREHRKRKREVST